MSADSISRDQSAKSKILDFKLKQIEILKFAFFTENTENTQSFTESKN